MRKLYLLLVMAMTLSLSAVALADEGDMATVEISGKEGYEGISGTATFTDMGDDTTKVVVELEGTPADGNHPAHLHDGTDCSMNKPVEHPLENVVDGMSTTTVDASFDHLVEANYYLNVHLSAEEVSTVVACGDEYVMSAGMPETGAGGLVDSRNSAPLAALALVGAVLAAGTFLVTRSRGI